MVEGGGEVGVVVGFVCYGVGCYLGVYILGVVWGVVGGVGWWGGVRLGWGVGGWGCWGLFYVCLFGYYREEDGVVVVVGEGCV